MRKDKPINSRVQQKKSRDRMLKSVGTEVGEFVYTGNISIELHY